MDFNLSNSYSYTQKETLKKFVLEFISSHSVDSMLDIGAGSLETAKPYSEAVGKYVAIEENKTRTEKLQKEGIHVLANNFPCDVSGTYDLVLSSHSVPEKVQEYKSFFEKAWSLVNEKGWLVIVTFKGASDTLLKFQCELTGKCNMFDEEKYNKILEILNNFGKPTTNKIISIEKTQIVDDLIEIICWSLRLDIKKWGSAVKEKLEKEFKKGNEFIFPHEHLVILLQKQE